MWLIRGWRRWRRRQWWWWACDTYPMNVRMISVWLSIVHLSPINSLIFVWPMWKFAATLAPFTLSTVCVNQKVIVSLKKSFFFIQHTRTSKHVHIHKSNNSKNNSIKSNKNNNGKKNIKYIFIRINRTNRPFFPFNPFICIIKNGTAQCVWWCQWKFQV